MPGLRTGRLTFRLSIASSITEGLFYIHRLKLTYLDKPLRVAGINFFFLLNLNLKWRRMMERSGYF